MQLLRAVTKAGDCGLLQLLGAVTATDDPDDVMKTNMMRRTMRMRRMLMVVRTMMRMMWRRVTMTMRVTMSMRMMMRIDLSSNHHG